MKILMVCLGNICRSPLAEGILRAKAQGTTLEIDSAGTSNFHEGETPDRRAVKTGRQNGVDISTLVSRPFVIEDFDNFDLIYTMDLSNFDNVRKMARNQEDIDKVKLILEEIFPGENREVPDPYFGGEEGFQNVFKMLNDVSEVIVKKYG